MRIAGHDTRAQMTASLHRLADFLDAHPDIPIPVVAHLDLTYFPGGDEADRDAEVERVARLLDTAPHREGPHYVAEHRTGAAAYRVIAIPDERRARHDALHTYADNIRP